MNHPNCELSEIESLLRNYSALKFQNSFLDYGMLILSDYNDKQLQKSIITLDKLKEGLLKNPENRVLKIKFQLKINQLKSIISTRKRLDLLNNDLKKLKHR
jgi:hypothetical protein